MDEKIQKFFYRHNIHINDIKYLSREENKTCIYMTDRTYREDVHHYKRFF